MWDLIVSIPVYCLPFYFPSEATVRNFNIRKLGLSQLQVSTELQNKSNITLYTDETSKKGKTVTGYHVSDIEGNTWVLAGLRELSNKSSSQTLETCKEILSDTDDCIQNFDKH